VPELASVAQALAHARLIGVDRLDAQLLLAWHLGRQRSWLLAHGDAPVTDGDTLRDLLMRRASGEPLAYLTGEREFHRLLLRVTPAVLIPRPDTEALVEWALELLPSLGAPRVVDLGTGSGAIALAIKHAYTHAQVHASDASAQALAVARANGQRLNLDVAWCLGDWWQAFDPALRFDLAVANPPYIAPGDPHLVDLRHEPLSALVSQGNGLADIECLIAQARKRLHPGGWLLLEHGFDQAEAVRKLLLDAGFDRPCTRPDLAGRPRVSGGQVGPDKA